MSRQLQLERCLRLVQKRPVIETVRNIAREPDRDAAFYVFEVDDVVRKVNLWREMLPRVHMFYAVKCNCHPAVLEVLAALGTGFDCASMGEVKQVLASGVDSSRIIYANPVKSVPHLRYTREADIPLMTFDNILELSKVKTHYPQAQLVLRIRCDAVTSTVCLGEKYGAALEEATTLLVQARTLGLEVVGVAFHVGSGCSEPYAYYRAVAAARQVFDEAEEVGFKLRLLDIGGGFPGNDSNMMVEQVRHVNRALDQYFPDDGSVKVIGEPGRYVVCTAFTLATTILGKRDILDHRGRRSSTHYYTDQSVYGSFNKHLGGGEPYTPTPLQARPDQATVPSTIWGHSCSSLDRLIRHIHLPDLTCGDWLLWRDMGAYTRSFSSDFNGFTTPEVEVVASYKTWSHIEECLAIRKKEAPENGTKVSTTGLNMSQDSTIGTDVIPRDSFKSQESVDGISVSTTGLSIIQPSSGDKECKQQQTTGSFRGCL